VPKPGLGTGRLSPPSLPRPQRALQLAPPLEPPPPRTPAVGFRFFFFFFFNARAQLCKRIWREDENSCVKALIDKGLVAHGSQGRPFPPEPRLPVQGGGEVAADQNIDDEGLFYINELARHIWKSHSQYQCPHCRRGFNHEQYHKHAMGCHPVQATIHFGRKDHTYR